MDKHTSMFVTYWIVFVAAMCSVALYDVGRSPFVITFVDAIGIALLASIWIGTVWEDKNK